MSSTEIQALRTRIGLNRREMAARLGYSVGHYREIENGRQEPSKLLKKLIEQIMFAEEAKKVLSTP